MESVSPITISRSLAKAYKGSKKELESLETQEDVVMSGIYLITLHLASLLQALSLNSTTGRNVKTEKVKEVCGQILHRVTLIYDQLNIELPEEDEVENYREGMPMELKVDSTLITFHMMSSISDIAQIVFVDHNGDALWADSHPPEDLEIDLLELIVDIGSLGEKFGFTMDEVWEELGVVYEEN